LKDFFFYYFLRESCFNFYILSIEIKKIIIIIKQTRQLIFCQRGLNEGQLSLKKLGIGRCVLKRMMDHSRRFKCKRYFNEKKKKRMMDHSRGFKCQRYFNEKKNKKNKKKR